MTDENSNPETQTPPTPPPAPVEEIIIPTMNETDSLYNGLNIRQTNNNKDSLKK